MGVEKLQLEIQNIIYFKVKVLNRLDVLSCGCNIQDYWYHLMIMGKCNPVRVIYKNIIGNASCVLQSSMDNNFGSVFLCIKCTIFQPIFPTKIAIFSALLLEQRSLRSCTVHTPKEANAMRWVQVPETRSTGTPVGDMMWQSGKNILILKWVLKNYSWKFRATKHILWRPQLYSTTYTGKMRRIISSTYKTFSFQNTVRITRTQVEVDSIYWNMSKICKPIDSYGMT